MGDPKSTSSSCSHSQPQPLPPGSRFYPSEEQLLCCYLPYRNNVLSTSSSANPNNINNGGLNVIKEINLYNYDPFDLPEVTCFRFGYRGKKRHWYCYTEKFNGGGGGGGERRRRAGCGFWKRKGRVRDVMGIGNGGGKVVLGRRSCFVFYIEKSIDERNKKSNALRTDWFMYEYALIDNVKAASVLCRIFVKSHGRNNTSEHALSSCAEESAKTVRHIGVQYYGSMSSDIGEAGASDHEVVGRKSITSIPSGLVGDRFQLTSGIQQNNLARPSGPFGPGSVLDDAIGTQQLMSILEGDFIELDDLV
ncbi:hypothetical protein Ancab_016404 [Ancistrocladus abbreviatus]